jgi:hypothetical protein
VSVVIPLDPIPNQSISIRLDGHRYVLTVKEIAGMMGVTITRDNVTLVDMVRAVAGFPLLPYGYIARDMGNFIFTHTDPGAFPYYEDFGTKSQLVYSTAAEIAADAAAAS